MDVWRAWNRLGLVKSLSFRDRPLSATNSGWSGMGAGDVDVERPDALSLIFRERGAWQPAGGREFPFRNVYRWTAALDGSLIRLEHLRFGAGSPVFLFDLMMVAEDSMESTEPHACSEDRYTARLTLDRAVIRFDWKIIGPRKDESLAYSYW